MSWLSPSLTARESLKPLSLCLPHQLWEEFQSNRWKSRPMNAGLDSRFHYKLRPWDGG